MDTGGEGELEPLFAFVCNEWFSHDVGQFLGFLE